MPDSSSAWTVWQQNLDARAKIWKTGCGITENPVTVPYSGENELILYKTPALTKQCQGFYIFFLIPLDILLFTISLLTQTTLRHFS